MWRGISEFLAFGKRDNFGGFEYRSAFAKQEAGNCKEEQ